MPYKKKPRRLDVKRIIELFGAPPYVASALKNANLSDVEPIAVKRWLDRGLIPSEHLVALTILARMNKMKFDPVDYWID